MFSTRASFDQTPNLHAQLLAKLRQTGASVIDLTESNPTRVALPYAWGAIQAALSDAAALPYTAASLGRPEARQCLAELWTARGVNTSWERIALTASTSEAYSALFKLFCDPGQTVLVPEPSYPLLAELARYDAVTLRPFRLEYDGAWHIDLSSLRAALSEDVRAIVVVSPNNPTGSFVRPEEFTELLRFGVPLISDEVFAAYGFGTEAPRSVLHSANEGLVVALDGSSKYALLPQMKLAWATFGGEPDLVAEALQRLEFILDAYLSVGGPVQAALPRLLEAAAPTRAALRLRTAHNLHALDQAFTASALSRLHVEGGWSAVVQLPAVRTEVEWVTGLLEDAGVLVQPGWFFDFATQPFCVLSLITPEAQFRRGLAQLVAYVNRYV